MHATQSLQKHATQSLQMHTTQLLPMHILRSLHTLSTQFLCYTLNNNPTTPSLTIVLLEISGFDKGWGYSYWMLKARMQTHTHLFF